MRTDKINYICDDCKAQAIFKSYKKARAEGWAVGEDYKIGRASCRERV